jgi:hypothetical protein
LPLANDQVAPDQKDTRIDGGLKMGFDGEVIEPGAHSRAGFRAGLKDADAGANLINVP